ncbi:hypothetical protein E2C01_036247 [Portunus trituberculatus]|uniref:Uncharacterized protein n=1 Tax=Portunus trituberculatus TaxID=210409 RepID=A0A5B7FBY5_PORTR|nr:hypothetical protein [Portunus trituberculatus]
MTTRQHQHHQQGNIYCRRICSPDAAYDPCQLQLAKNQAAEIIEAGKNEINRKKAFGKLLKIKLIALWGGNVQQIKGHQASCTAMSLQLWDWRLENNETGK